MVFPRIEFHADGVPAFFSQFLGRSSTSFYRIHNFSFSISFSFQTNGIPSPFLGSKWVLVRPKHKLATPKNRMHPIFCSIKFPILFFVFGLAFLGLVWLLGVPLRTSIHSSPCTLNSGERNSVHGNP